MLNTVNGIMQSLMPTAMASAKAKQENNKGKENKPVPVNSSSDEVIITKRISDMNNSINYIKTKFIYLVYGIVNQLNRVYSFIGNNSKGVGTEVGILFFMLFSIFIVRKRDEIAKNISKRIVENRLA